MPRNFYSNSNRRIGRVCNSVLLILATIICSTSACATPQGRVQRVQRPRQITREISIIPQPGSITLNEGYFEFSPNTKIIATDRVAVNAATSLNNILSERYRFTLQVTTDTGAPNSITFLPASDQSQLGAEGYSLRIEPDSIQISGADRGMFYGIQSLVQLFPADSNGETQLPAAVIRDAPRFGYRGMHLDVARHFMPVEFVKKYIRLISRYKYNYFHWHLTDDQGWRIEIKQYPKLTEIGSWRPDTVRDEDYLNTFKGPNPYKGPNRYKGFGKGDNTPVKGFYTQEQIRDIVNYARERYVTIIPEIDLPGHSAAALASYPEFGCKKNHKYEVHRTWGAFPDILCPTEPTFKFIEGVLNEVISLFPDSPYIHIGGDEVKFTQQWAESPDVQNLLRTEKNVSTMGDVQKWFMERVAGFVNSKQKKAIVWDEMVPIGLPPNATVMVWDKVQNATIAARLKHKVIRSPMKGTYFDHRLDDKDPSKSIYTNPITLESVYDFDPTAGFSPEEARYIIGGQGCLWTEMMKTPEDVEYKMFPRAIALAEALWSRRENKNINRFTNRLNKEYRNLDREQVNYRVPLSETPQRTTAQVFQPVFETAVPGMRVSGRPLVSVQQVLQARSLGGKAVPYRISVPPDYESSNRRFPVLYLLHGVNGNENEWWDRSQLTEYASKYQMIVVTPGVGDSWYANSASDTGARYEDVIVYDLIPYIDAHYRTISNREGRAIAGVSMGGLGAMKLALRYPQLFEFAGSLSGPFDVPITGRWGKAPSAKMLRDLQLIFGDEGSQTRRENDVFQLLNQALNGNTVLPYLYVSSGISDPLPQVAQSNQRFAQALGAKDLRFEYNKRPGTHDWRLWDSEIFLMLGRMCVFMKRIC